MLEKSGKIFDSEDLLLRQTFSGSSVIYEGKAAPGTLDSEEKWQIKKHTYVNNKKTATNFASGNNEFIYVWNDRASYTYS